jgi:WD40 repeat protein
MRHTILCLSCAFIAAILTFVLISAILFSVFNGPGLVWFSAFFVPFFFYTAAAVAFVVGTIAFVVASENLPDRNWMSMQTFVIVIPVVAIIFVATPMLWRLYLMAHPPEVGPQQTGLPSLHLAKTFRWRVSRLAWSADGQQMAASGGNGITTWSPDGDYQKEFPLSGAVLSYLFGHKLLIMSPVKEADDIDWKNKLPDLAFSIVDAETGKILQSVPGPHPGEGWTKNNIVSLAVSTDERLLALSTHQGPPATNTQKEEPQIHVYSTVNWQQVASVNLHTGDKEVELNPNGLAFSPDGKTLAVIHGSHCRIEFFDVESWTPARTLVAYIDPSLPMNVEIFNGLAFSPDGTMIAVQFGSGGSRWIYPHGVFGPGILEQGFPADPLRVYRISDGSLVASLGSFPGGISRLGPVWSPTGKYIAFEDALGNIRFWSPFKPHLSVEVAHLADTPGDSLLFSKDGSKLAANFWGNVRIFDVVPPD